MLVSIIDLGSNSVRMDIAEIDENGGKSRYVRRCRELVRLSEGMSADGCIQPEAADRAIEALHEFKAIMKELGADDCIAVATAAVRGAQNRDEFCSRVLNEIGIAINVIPGEQEAEYDFMGVMSAVDIEDCVIVDTGGGSTELILAGGGEALARESIPVGAVNMTEQFLSYGETPEALNALQDYISSQLDKIGWLDDAQGLPVVALGGSVYNLAVVSSGRRGADRNALHGTKMTSKRVKEVLSELCTMTAAERADAGIEAGRADTVICGIMPSDAVMDKLGSDTLVVSSAGLKEGILAEFVENMGF